MPELPEVRTVVKFLKENLTNKTIDQFQLFYNPLVVNLKTTNDVIGSIQKYQKMLHHQEIEDVFAYGKYIIFKLSNMEMISHLRMEGRWVIEPISENTYNPDLIEAQFSFTNDSRVLRYYDFRRFGTLEFVEKDQWNQIPAIAKLGYEPFDSKATPQWLYASLQRSKKAIKTVLLDQTILLGLGNIYVNEVLFATKINPLRPANMVSLEECAQILANSVKIFTESIEMGGTTIHSFSSGNNVEGKYQSKLQVHGRANQKCFVCQSIIMKNVVNGRGTYYCPKCQQN